MTYATMPLIHNLATGEVKNGRELPTGALWAADRRERIPTLDRSSWDRTTSGTASCAMEC